MKKMVCFLASAIFLGAAEPPVEKPEDVNYNWLMTSSEEGSRNCHVVCFKEIFDKLKTKALLEFGMDYSTKIFLDSCKKVISVEVITHGYGPDRMKRFLEFYKGYSNWIPIAYFSGHQGDTSWASYKYMGSDSVYKAGSYQCATWLHYAQVDPFYLKELGEFLANLTKYNKVDIAFVHPILFLRGDLVQLLFDKVPIIVAHHTKSRSKGKEDAFGYVRVSAPENYEEIYVPTKHQGEIIGTSIWVIKKPEYEEIVHSLKKIDLQEKP